MSACCEKFKLFLSLSVVAMLAGIGGAAGYAWMQSRHASPALPIVADAAWPTAHADTAIKGDKYSMATTAISEQADGLIVLDHNSGLLQVSVMYPRLAQFGATFQANVAELLNISTKGGDYMMVTGRADFPRSSSQPAAATLIYVMDTATGSFGAFGVPFDRSAMNSNRQQSGSLVLVATGSANPIIDRDALR